MRPPYLRPAALLAACVLTATALAACGGGGEDYPAPRVQMDEPADATAYPAPGEGGVMTEDMVQGLGGAALVVGTDATYPPMESVDASGKIVGFDPALMAEICRIADCKPTFQATAWDGIFAALAAREFDVLMSAITILPEREASGKAKFTDPYHSVGQVILVRADEQAITGVDQLKDATVGVQQGTTGDTAATQKGGVPDANMKRFGENALAVQALKNGDVDAVVCDAPTAARYVAEDPGAFKVAGEPFTYEEYGILVPADRTDVLAAFNSAIADLKADGTIERLLAEYRVGQPVADDAGAADGATTGAAAGEAVTTTTTTITP